MSHGFAYVPHNDLVTLVLSEFRCQLSHALTVNVWCQLSHALTVNVWCGAIPLPRQCLTLRIADIKGGAGQNSGEFLFLMNFELLTFPCREMIKLTIHI